MGYSSSTSIPLYVCLCVCVYVCVCGVVRGCRVVGGDAHPSVLICRGWLQSARLPCHLRAARNVSSAPELLSQLRNTDWKQIYTSMGKRWIVTLTGEGKRPERLTSWPTPSSTKV